MGAAMHIAHTSIALVGWLVCAFCLRLVIHKWHTKARQLHERISTEQPTQGWINWLHALGAQICARRDDMLARIHRATWNNAPVNSYNLWVKLFWLQPRLGEYKTNSNKNEKFIFERSLLTYVSRSCVCGLRCTVGKLADWLLLLEPWRVAMDCNLFLKMKQFFKCLCRKRTPKKVHENRVTRTDCRKQKTKINMNGWVGRGMLRALLQEYGRSK